MNGNFTNLFAAGTAASTAFLASLIAISPATAATFTPVGRIGERFEQQWTIESPSAESVEDLLSEFASDSAQSEWQVRYGGEELKKYTPAWGRRWGLKIRDRWGWWDDNGVLAFEFWVEGSYVGLFDKWNIYWFPGVLMERWEGEPTAEWDRAGEVVATVPEPSSAIALGVLGLGAVASRLRRRSK